MNGLKHFFSPPLLVSGAVFTSLLLTAGPALADGTLTGDIGVTLTIGDGCTVGNGSISGSTNEWGTLDFGTYADLTSVIDGTVAGSDGTNVITLTCSNGLSPTLTIDGGLNESSSLRYLAGTGTDTIAYRLYSDAARSTEVAIDGAISITANGSAVELPLYGRVLPADQTTTAPAAGSYNDTVVATLAW